jgi:hypothetical protein
MRRASTGLLLAAALLVWAPPAWASRSAESEGQPSGDITLTWHGDPARGCAAAGVCDVSGSLTYTPDDVFTYGELQADGRFEPDELDLDSGDSSTVRVRTGNSAGESGLCLDLVENSFELALRRGSGGHYRVGLFNDDVGGFSSGRCAGPLRQELASLFPIGSFDAGGLGRHSAVLDLSQKRPFVAGPFSGELTSTIRARMPRVEADDESSSSTIPSNLLPRKRRELMLVMEYRLRQGSGSLVSNFAGTAHPFCLPFDACGVRGSINYSASATPDSGSLTIYAHRRVGKHEQVSLRSALRDLRANRLRLELLLDPGEGTQGRVSSSLSRADGSTCTDPGESASTDIALEQRRGGIRFGLDASDDATVDALRTHCQGPDERDIRGAEPLAGAIVTYRELLRKRVRVRLTPKASFASVAYAGTLAGSLGIELDRVALQAGVDYVYPFP